MFVQDTLFGGVGGRSLILKPETLNNDSYCDDELDEASHKNRENIS